MALSFPCDHCAKEIAVRFLKPGEEAVCAACGGLTRVPNDAVVVDASQVKVIRESALSVPSFGGPDEGFALTGTRLERAMWPFQRITTRERAQILIRHGAMGYVFVGAFSILAGLFWNPVLLVDGIVYVVLALVLMKWKLRWAAIVLLVLSCLGVVVKLLAWLDIISVRSGNILITLLLAWGAARAVEAAAKLRAGFPDDAVAEGG